MIEFALRQHLIDDGIGAAVFTESPDQQTARPYIVLQLRPGSRRHYHTKGASGLVEAAVAITCHADTYEGARALYDAIRDAIDGFSGHWDGTRINVCFLSTPFAAGSAPVHGDETGGPAVGAIASVHYYESIPALGVSS